MSSLITRVDVLVTSPSRNYVTLKITTDDGVVGWGDATLNGRELAVATYLRDHVAPILVGRDAERIEDTWQYLYRGVYWRRGPVTMAAIGAVDLALWDIKGKATGRPVYQLLGGAVRDRVLTYTHATGWDVPELIDSVDEKLARGFPRRPGAVRRAGPRRRLRRAPWTASYEPAGRGVGPVVEVWDTAAYLRHAPDVLAAVRDHVGPELHLLHDAHHRLTPIQAARLARDLEPVRPVLARGRHPRREPGGVAARASAHHHSPGHRRGLQHHLGRPGPHHRAAHRLRAHRGHARRWNLARTPDRRPRRAVRRQGCSARAVGRLADLPGGVAAPRTGDPPVRDPGVHGLRPAGRARCSALPTGSTTATCTPATRPGSGSRSTRKHCSHTPTTRPTCRSHALATAR